ncbi:hypothetical protein SAMN04489751_1312 [Brevibacterium sandarakinum]|uniref:Glycosyl hydrolase family 79, N-terminal domain n=1 Tax=Brevibacterium sandarakinum TaxID=629680 RepID=A0A1H1PQL8_BRESA|nr:hypothetical protein [Brevibacterium sandarakinum]SDS13601.1 hypothetical protein SAMN04489751_1312 [Brevibacterium sandarakinum]
MVIRRAIVACSASIVLLLSACTFGSSSDEASTPAEPSPKPTVFEQKFSSDTRGEAATLSLSGKKTNKNFRVDNIGLSLESTVLADRRLDPEASNLDYLLNSLGSPALRFGGNELDRRLFWTSDHASPSKSDQVVVTPEDLKRLKKLVDVTGSTVTMGIPLGTYAPKQGVDMAVHTVDILGDSLVGLAIGNEPNGYKVKDVPNGAVRGNDWNKEKYVQQLEAYAKAIHAKRPDAPIIGPEVYDGAWMDAFAHSDVKKKSAISQHWYQLPECESEKVPGRGPEAQNLVDPLAKKSAQKNLGIGKDHADDAGLPLWLEETGPTSCPGTNDTSLTNASALWAADYTLYAAQLGVERMAMHSMLGACEGGAPMSLVCDPADHGTRSDTFQGRPHLAAMRLLVPSTGGTFTRTAVKGGGNMSAYTVRKNEGETLVTTVINANDAAKSGGNPVSFQMPKGFSVERASQIYGPSNEAKNATSVIPSNPLPDDIPYSGGEKSAEASASTSTGADELKIDIAASSVTVFIMTKT